MTTETQREAFASLPDNIQDDLQDAYAVVVGEGTVGDHVPAGVTALARMIQAERNHELLMLRLEQHHVDTHAKRMARAGEVAKEHLAKLVDPDSPEHKAALAAMGPQGMDGLRGQHISWVLSRARDVVKCRSREDRVGVENALVSLDAALDQLDHWDSKRRG